MSVSTRPDLGPLFYTVPDIASRLDVTDRCVWGLVQSGQIRSVKIGRSRRIPAEAFLNFVEQLDDAPSSRAS